MDRDLAPHVRRRTQLRGLLKIAGVVVLVGVVLLLLPGWMRPTVALSRVRTGTVVAGPIDASVTASGVVTPALERVVSSPLEARVLRVLKRPGATLTRGDAVVELDVADSVLALQRAESDRQVTENQQRQTKLGYDKQLVDLDGRIAIKALELETLQAELSMHRQLAARGLLSKEELSQSELKVKQAEIERAQLAQQRDNAASTTALQIEGLMLERATIDRDVAEKRRVLDLATTKADRDGVLTWVISEEGALVRRGDVIARIADLSAFRVEATASDIHADRIRAGLPAVVRIDDVVLEGHVSEVNPTVDQGSVRFTVDLAEASHPRLRPSLRADVHVVTDRRPKTLMVPRGPFADGTGARQVFVVRGDRAVRTDVQLGVSNFEYVEVVSGLSPGDEIILSDMRDYLHLEDVAVRR